MTLTISQLAEYAGVTVRAVRHYHARGLLAEPERDSSGYRRYGAQAVIDLIRIRTLAEAGVPLARVEEVLTADADALDAAVGRIDQALSEEIAELETRRARLADLSAGDRLYVGEELATFLDELRAIGIHDLSVDAERDSWILILATHPQQASRWLAEKRTYLADPEFRAIYLLFDAARDWVADDPRVFDLLDRILAWTDSHAVGDEPGLNDPLLASLMQAQFGDETPAIQRLGELYEARQR